MSLNKRDNVFDMGMWKGDNRGEIGFGICVGDFLREYEVIDDLCIVINRLPVRQDGWK